MKIVLRILKGLLIIAYFLGLLYLVINNKYFTDYFNIQSWAVPAIAILSILLAGYNYIKIYLKVDKLESEFTNIVNHVFRTPLTKIVWSLDELKLEEKDKQKLLYLQNIENSADRILDIVDIIVGIQDVDNHASYHFDKISIRQILEKSISKYREIIEQKKFNFKIELFTDIPPLTLDLKKMSFVFDALMENALHYTPDGGDIKIGTIPNEKKAIIFTENSGFALSFRDRKNIFNRFYRTNSAKVMNTDGMGLSLYLSKKIIERHGGKIYVKNKKDGKGVAFYVELPLNKKKGEIK